MPLSFQRGKSAGLAATYHFTFTGDEAAQATVVIRSRKLDVLDGHHGEADLKVTADGATWLRFLAKEVSIFRALATRRVRVKGRLRLLAAFGRCFPA